MSPDDFKKKSSLKPLNFIAKKSDHDLKAKENSSQSQNNHNTKSQTSKSAKVSSNIEQTLISQLEKMFSLAFAKKRKEQKQDREREPKNQKRTLERDNKENLSAQKRAELEGKNREVSMDDPDVLEGLLTDDPDKETSKTRGKDKRRIREVIMTRALMQKLDHLKQIELHAKRAPGRQAGEDISQDIANQGKEKTIGGLKMDFKFDGMSKDISVGGQLTEQKINEAKNDQLGKLVPDSTNFAGKEALKNKGGAEMGI